MFTLWYAYVQLSFYFFSICFYRLHQIIAHKEIVFETLVTPERLHAVSAELHVTQQENKRVSSAHRHLLIRYAALKFMIDEAFRKLDDARRHIGKLYSLSCTCQTRFYL